MHIRRMRHGFRANAKNCLSSYPKCRPEHTSHADVLYHTLFTEFIQQKIKIGDTIIMIQ